MELKREKWGRGRAYPLVSAWKKTHKHKLFALVNVRMALGQTAGCPRVNRAKKFMCSPRNTGNINFSLWLTGGLSEDCPDFQKVDVSKVYVPFSCLKLGELSLRGQIFPLRENFPSKIAFPFPRNGLFPHEMKGLRKTSLYGLREDV